MKNFVRMLSLALVAVLLGATLVSCFGFGAPNADPDKAEKALDEAGYMVAKIDNEIAVAAAGKSLGVDDLECVVTALADEEAVAIYYFEEADDAKEAFKVIKEKAEKQEEEYDVVVKRSGKMVYMGTKQAIKDAK